MNYMGDFFNNYPMIAVAIIAGLSGSIGYYIKYFLDKNSEKISAYRVKQREVYIEFMKLIFKVLHNAKENEEVIDIKEFYDLYPELVIYSSKKVIVKISVFFQKLRTGDPSDFPPYLEAIIAAIREDLGLKNPWDKDDLLQPIVNDLK